MTRTRRTVRVVVTCATGLCAACSAPAPPGANTNSNDGDSGAPRDRVGSGTARLSGVIYSADEELNIPLAGAVLALGDSVSIAKANGAFDLFGVPSGLQPMLIDGSRLVAGDGQYGQFATHLPITEGEERLLDEPIYLPFVPNTARVSIVPEEEAELVGAGGTVVRVPAGAARDDEALYDGWLALLDVPADRAPLPLPQELLGGSRALLTLQPLGVEFPAPLAVRIADPSPDAEHPWWALMALDFPSGQWRDTAVLQQAGPRRDTINGGIRASGWFLYSADMHVRVYAACASDDAAPCVAAWERVRRDLAGLRIGAAAGARATLQRLALAMLDHERTETGAGALLESSIDDFRICRENLTILAASYRRFAELESIRGRAQQAAEGCGAADTCDADLASLTLAGRRCLRSLNEAAANVNLHAPRFQRLEQAMRELSDFYELIEPLDEQTLEAFEQAVDDFLETFADFDPLKSPADANDALLSLLDESETGALDVLAELRIPVSDADAPDVRVLQLSENEGLRASSGPSSGVAAIRLRASDEDLFIWTLERRSGRCSAPRRLSGWLEESPLPLESTLDHAILPGALSAAQPAAGQVSAPIPVHTWSFTAPPRQGAEISFISDEPLLLALSTPQDPVLAAHRGGFHITNLPQGGAYLLDVLGADLEDDATIAYRLQFEVDENLFDFGQPVRGAFDLFRRAEVICFEGQAGEGLTVDLRCCDMANGALSYGVFEPSGKRLSAVSGPDVEGAPGVTAFELEETGLHRLILVPADGVFTDYELVLTKSPPREPLDYTPGTDVTLDFDTSGRGVTLRFPGEAGRIVELRGLSAEGLDRLSVHVERADGQIVVEQAALYFDGSAFSLVRFTLPADDHYLATLIPTSQGEPTAGRATIRLDLLAGPGGP